MLDFAQPRLKYLNRNPHENHTLADKPFTLALKLFGILCRIST